MFVLLCGVVITASARLEFDGQRVTGTKNSSSILHACPVKIRLAMGRQPARDLEAAELQYGALQRMQAVGWAGLDVLSQGVGGL
jgi:hypothetical protein